MTETIQRKAMFRKETRISGEERFRGVVTWMVGTVRSTDACKLTRSTKVEAIADAKVLAEKLAAA